jgi:hypothetical protein
MAFAKNIVERCFAMGVVKCHIGIVSQRPDVVRFSVVIPGNDLDVLGLERHDMNPAVEL